jgi:hypothetical protein
MPDVTPYSGNLTYRGKITSLSNSGGSFYSFSPDGNPRSCIYVRKHINALSLLELCSRDATTVRMTYTSGGSCEKLIITSSYLP